jgi:deoxyribose-phosphate aldolase
MPELTQLAKCIDHTLLKPEATRAEIDKLCQEAIQYKFATVCVQPFRVAQATELLLNSDVAVCTVVGFPLGAQRAEIKALETVRAIADGATEIDMVLNLGALKDKNYAAVQTDIEAVVKASRGRPVKVILETSLLSNEEIIKSCELARDAGAQFVKTSTGFSSGGATVEAVQLMKQTVGDKMKIKASGGIRTREAVQSFLDAGADRIGTSAGVAICSGVGGGSGY